jgi:hypothetical protein
MSAIGRLPKSAKSNTEGPVSAAKLPLDETAVNWLSLTQCGHP